MRTSVRLPGECVTVVDVINRPASGGVRPASCLMLAALCISTLPVVAGPLDTLERPRYEIARPETLSVRAHHKTKRNDIQIGKQTVPPGASPLEMYARRWPDGSRGQLCAQRGRAEVEFR
jgi:hypothetical protein